MGGLPSLLTAVLLRAAPSCTPAEARPERLPPNFVEVAACVLRVLNNVARWGAGAVGGAGTNSGCLHFWPHWLRKGFPVCAAHQSTLL